MRSCASAFSKAKTRTQKAWRTKLASGENGTKITCRKPAQGPREAANHMGFGTSSGDEQLLPGSFTKKKSTLRVSHAAIRKVTCSAMLTTGENSSSHSLVCFVLIPEKINLAVWIIRTVIDICYWMKTIGSVQEVMYLGQKAIR